MNRKCEIVTDLLPLYAENIASASSCELIELHLESCEDCRTKLVQIRQKLPLPVETKTEVLSMVNKGMRKRIVYSVFLAVILALTVFAGILVCGLVPVWMNADEAIISVEPQSDGVIRVEAAEHVYGVNGYNNSICFETLRLDWFVNAAVKQMRQESERYFYFHLDEGESLWYSGEQTWDEDLLLWGDGTYCSETFNQARGNKTIIYLFVISLTSGVLLLITGWFFRKNRGGKTLMYFALFALCCAASCLFVTNGYLLSKDVVGTTVRFNRLPQQLIAIAVMSLLSFCSMLLGYLTCTVYRN